MADVPESTLDSRVAPTRVLSGHSDCQFRDDLHDPRSPGGSALVGPLLGDELPVPTKDGVGSDERSNVGEGASSDGLPSHGKPSALIVGQSKSLATELLLQDTVLFSEIVDDRVLLPANPACHGGDEDLPGLKDDGHPGIVARKESIRQLSSTVRIGLFFPAFGSARIFGHYEGVGISPPNPPKSE